ncbi:30S ribosomal protein S18 [Candidatus Shapirobacteria bacterium CG_4_9_14_3_um_filter_39_13]|uniref:Small ribosomal subunit protein bS18 n=1 Tax=Candidatus Shapirobacteria bacterium CG_4_9_14_3_um_filter_39_13 TaxID=1974479 RepID=A0A2M7XM67_9BACT|nr:MAG: 30S ribosomal protein S18 [Candidatus Shapirobacteria bacterium CG_4_9_14_3_um_filter_39_13]
MNNSCPFCQSGQNPDYKEPEMLKKYLSDQGKIVKHLRTGVCAKHQRKLATAIKQARFLALLPFTARVS